MFAFSQRIAAATRASTRAFSTTPSRSADLAKLVLIGRLGKVPELRYTRNNKEYVQYTVATTNYPPPPLNSDGTRNDPKTTWHSILSFNEGVNNYLRMLKSGSQVYVEANFELREPDPVAEADSPQGQRQIFLRHGSLTVLLAICLH
ncbi:single-strand binding protein family-domain-containing protein [Rhodofomes roseus]|uniref:Single-strand binding protein family-domain-containing protein n=1 Tax=Rhodofomes roseus TaxID=34475 RepID=A0ABQ8KY34_9APHY|nr:single-strand binding protein family-domain-containing protein [Rhodofomes roseus]KAH9843958.1 single-strand binding protein family-domain-containing protein [Rhodofomes roseus]